MSCEAGTRGHVTGAAGRLREARVGASFMTNIGIVSDAFDQLECQIIGAPLAGMRARRMLSRADTLSPEALTAKFEVTT